MSDTHLDLGRRERQIMEVVYRLGRATVGEVLAEMADPPSYSSVRTMLGKLEEKRRLTHEQDGPRYVYRPVVSRQAAQASTLKGVVSSLFDGSTERAVTALLDLGEGDLGDEEFDRLAGLIERMRRKGR